MSDYPPDGPKPDNGIDYSKERFASDGGDIEIVKLGKTKNLPDDEHEQLIKDLG